ncbi:hypothetical protein C8J56DRAFT_923168, partial [Mycena floridula]
MADTPTDSPSPFPNIERSLFWGQIWMNTLWGVEVFMYLYSVHLFRKASPTTRRTRRLYTIVGGLILATVTVSVFTDAVLLSFMWIDHRDTIGGPLAYFSANTSAWWQVFGTASNQVTVFLGDGLLIYRCYVIWNGRRSVLALPILLYLAAFSMAIVFVVQTAIPGSLFFAQKSINFGVPWVALTATFNVLVTFLITFRILKTRRAAKRVSSMNSELIGEYTGLPAILIEASLPFSILGIVFAVTYGKNVDEASAFILIWSVFAALSPQFIIFRIASGQGWTQQVASEITGGTKLFGPEHGEAHEMHDSSSTKSSRAQSHV